MWFLLFLIVLVQNIKSNEVYSNRSIQGNFYSKECCLPITTLTIPNKVKQCTVDTFVYFKCDQIEKSGFLTKEFEIMSNSPDRICTDSIENFIKSDEFVIQKVNNLVLVNAGVKDAFYFLCELNSIK